MNVPYSTLDLAGSLQAAANDIHLWRISLDVSPEQLDRLHGMLSSSERERSRRFVIERLSRRFIVGRAATRWILARYTGQDASELQFDHGPHGKPALVGADAEQRVRFNVSHSADEAIVAVAWHREVGVDVEAIRQIMHLDRMIQKCLGPGEQQSLLPHGGANRLKGFLRHWTHKEAYLKAIGAGLRIPLGAVQFDLRQAGRSRIVRTPDCPEARASVHQAVELCVGDGYVGALVAQGPDPPEIRYMDWQVNQGRIDTTRG
jgi:4'-phosphopantetheinyl transferase